MNNILKLFSFLVALCFSVHVFADHSNMDVYGTNEKKAAKIINQFGTEIAAYAQCHAAEHRLKPECQFEKQAKIKKTIIEKIRKNGDFAYVNISTVTYPEMREHPGIREFITIDVVEKKDKSRVAYLAQFKSKNFNKNIKKSQELDRLIKQWASYENVGLELFYKQEIRSVKNCSAYHCTWGFEHADLKKYQAVFDKEVPKYKTKLVETLKRDPDENRRSAAACLLAHIKNGKELVDILTPSISDPSEEVRNDVMRVLESTLAIVKPTNFNIDPIIQALDSPVLTDRNKALCMIMSLSEQPKYARYVAEHAGASLMASLKMIQPNLHSAAYVVSQRISGKTYGEHDYELWQNWFLEQAKG